MFYLVRFNPDLNFAGIKIKLLEDLEIKVDS
jgi:hypothetical protein